MVYNFIRGNLTNLPYTGGIWVITAGSINVGFIKYVNEVDTPLGIVLSDHLCITDYSGNKIDFTHMIATIDGYYADFPPKYWAGWAGDVATLTKDVIKATGNSSDSSVLTDKAVELLGSDAASFSYQDINADLDGHNLYNKIYNNNMPISTAFNYYYNNSEYKSRYVLFVNAINNEKSNFTDGASKDFDQFIVWYISGSDGLYEGLNISANNIQKEVVSSVFANYIMTMYDNGGNSWLYPNNAKIINDFLYIRDSNGNIISGRQVDIGDNITVLDVGYTNQLVLVEYPTPQGVASGYVTNAVNCIQYFYQNMYSNGSTSETVYDESGNVIGSLDPWEKCTPLYRKNGRLHVVYNTSKGTNTKSGYVVYDGGFTEF